MQVLGEERRRLEEAVRELGMQGATQVIQWDRAGDGKKSFDLANRMLLEIPCHGLDVQYSAKSCKKSVEVFSSTTGALCLMI